MNDGSCWQGSAGVYPTCGAFLGRLPNQGCGAGWASLPWKAAGQEEANTAELKTKTTDQSVGAFLKHIENPRVRRDCQTLIKMMSEATKAKPKMWGSSIVGFGTYHSKYASGREGDWFLTGFAEEAEPDAVHHVEFPGIQSVAGPVGTPQEGEGLPVCPMLGGHRPIGAAAADQGVGQAGGQVLEQLLKATVSMDD